MKSLRTTIAAAAAVCFMSAVAFAADPSGTWKWTETSGRSGGQGTPREVTLKLAMKDGKLSGEYSRPGRDGNMTTTAITNASMSGDTVSFTVEREYNGNKYATKYNGKLAGDTITGNSERPGRDGQSTKGEWMAKRSK